MCTMARKSGAAIEQGIINLHFKQEAADMANIQTEKAAELADAVAQRIEQQINKLAVNHAANSRQKSDNF